MAADAITLSYNSRTIATLSQSGLLLLKTGGKVCETDIEMRYISHCPRAEGRSAFNVDDFLTQTCEQHGAAHIEQNEEE